MADHAPPLYGRDPERETLEQLTTDVGNGQAQVLVLHGDAGVGKTALMDYLAKSASEFRVERALGIQSEMVLAFAGVHQLCAGMLDRVGELPDPQRNALETALGIGTGPTPDRFLVSLAVLNLLSAAAEEQPLLGLIDDAQWLDWASKQVLTFVARRLLAEPIGLVFAVRDLPSEFSGLPGREVRRLNDRDAKALLSQVMPGRLDAGVRDRIVAETRGNALAILELSHELTVADLGGGYAAPEPGSLTKLIEQTYSNRLQSLPANTNRLLLAAAAEPTGDVSLLWGAIERMGIDPQAATPAMSSGLLEVGARVQFPHPLMRSAVYGAASLLDRQAVHRALAESVDAEVDPDLKAWHLARSVSGYDEDVALELERSAERAQARGGVAAAAAFLESSAQMTKDPLRRTRLLLAAAQTMLYAGAFESASDLLSVAEDGEIDEAGKAQTDHLRAAMAFMQSRAGDAVPLFLAAARRLEKIDVRLARDTYLEAIVAAIFTGRLGGGPWVEKVGEAARHVPNPESPRFADDLLDAIALRITERRAAATSILKPILQRLCHEDLPEAEARRWLWLGSAIAAEQWDDESWHAAATRHLALTREVGALSELQHALDSRAHFHLLCGEVAKGSSLYDEANAVNEAIGSERVLTERCFLAAWRGENEARELIEETTRKAMARGQGNSVLVLHTYDALLSNSLGQYENALNAAQEAARYAVEFPNHLWHMPELAEAAARSGQTDLAGEAVELFAETAQASGTDWGLGVEARSRALLAEGDNAERLHREAIERLARTRIRTDLARARLLYGEWLRREGRRRDAREQLRAAFEAFSEFGAEAFAERARRELVATGETARKRTVDTTFELTTQESLIARLASEGFTNPEIGTQLFLSPRTVEYHLHKVFTKVGVTSRRELRSALQKT